ncbi:MAG: ERCC4-type nuclease [Theionarchaea archaeon]|nr:ERCC4-type nuclease [Theionarchaea archaeon]
MHVLIDYREITVQSLLMSLSGMKTPPVHVEVAHLPLGDFFLVSKDTGVLIERKSTSDFISSLRSSRLWDQLLRFMKASTLLGHPLKQKLLIVHGTFDREPPVSWPQIMGAYMEILFVYDIPLIVCEDDEALYQCLRILIKREAQGKNEVLPGSHWFRKHCSPSLPEMDLRRYVLASIPSIGDVLAENLLDHFGTIAAVAHATEKQLRRVEGVGKKKAEKIHSIFH